MKKNVYQEPSSVVVEVLAESVIAASIGGDAGGSGQDMPWGSNESNGFEEMPWLDNGSEE